MQSTTYSPTTVSSKIRNGVMMGVLHQLTVHSPNASHPMAITLYDLR
jgi:hypothetical protein